VSRRAGIPFVMAVGEGAICRIGGGIMTPTSMTSVGNLATEDLVHFLNTMGVETGVSTESVLAAAGDIARMPDIQSNAFVVSSDARKSIMDEARAHQRFHPA
jgi:hydroxymethylglutaryl-CoA lyase